MEVYLFVPTPPLYRTKKKLGRSFWAVWNELGCRGGSVLVYLLTYLDIHADLQNDCGLFGYVWEIWVYGIPQA